jgi:hypothetical protein
MIAIPSELRQSSAWHAGLQSEISRPRRSGSEHQERRPYVDSRCSIALDECPHWAAETGHIGVARKARLPAHSRRSRSGSATVDLRRNRSSRFGFDSRRSGARTRRLEPRTPNKGKKTSRGSARLRNGRQRRDRNTGNGWLRERGARSRSIPVVIIPFSVRPRVGRGRSSPARRTGRH